MPKLLTLLLFILCLPLRAEEPLPRLRVLSWNVGPTKETPLVRKQFAESISTIIATPHSPDLIVLVEASRETLMNLAPLDLAKYGYDQFAVSPYVYAEGGELLILLWKSERIRFQKNRILPLDYTSVKALPGEELRYREIVEAVEKALPHVKLIKQSEYEFVLDGSKKFYLYPVHFLNIWPTLENFFYPEALEGAKSILLPHWVEEKNAKFSATAVTLQMIMRNKTNPHFSQVTSFLNGVRGPDESSLVIGDFNSFPRVDGVRGTEVAAVFGTTKSIACQEFEKTFRPLYAPEGQYSFPAQSFLEQVADHHEQLLIDLGYYRGPLWKRGRATVMKLEGSDHYPVLYDLFLKD